MKKIHRSLKWRKQNLVRWKMKNSSTLLFISEKPFRNVTRKQSKGTKTSDRLWDQGPIHYKPFLFILKLISEFLISFQIDENVFSVCTIYNKSKESDEHFNVFSICINFFKAIFPTFFRHFLEHFVGKSTYNYYSKRVSTSKVKSFPHICVDDKPTTNSRDVIYWLNLIDKHKN